MDCELTNLYHGAPQAKLDDQIGNELSTRVVPVLPTQEELLITPNFILDARGPQISPTEVEKQACYYSTLGARAILTLRSYRQDRPVYDNKVYTITATYCHGLLELYPTHPAECDDANADGVQYVMTRLGTWSMHATLEIFRQGIAAYRNARDWAEGPLAKDSRVRQRTD
ncbi:hypothetical protein BJX61DRAFT_459447 [Aspergillus egyptiacus]|nr:hypothetical protein BJX61DRAFT_459447 [Aspergillus egyptiacus]